MTIIMQEEAIVSPTEHKYLTPRGVVKTTKIAIVDGRSIYWLGFGYTIYRNKIYQGFYSTLLEAVEAIAA
tara:strand:- start:1550 stop:1759 length:210 start_codon:yes stop_codon:yes gene_type:complete